MKALWSGTLSVGLVNVPIKLYTATEDKDIRFHLYHKGCGSSVQYKKFCADEQEELDGEDIERGYEYTKGKHVSIDDALLADLPVPSRHGIEVDSFVNADDVDPVYFQKSYFLGAQPGGERGYALLVEALRQTGRAGVGRVTLREKEHQALIRPHGEALLLTTLFDADEVRPSDAFAVAKVPAAKELGFAVALVEALSAEFDPAAHVDGYREALMTRITARIEGNAEPVAPVLVKPKTNQDELFAMLKASVEAAKGKNIPTIEFDLSGMKGSLVGQSEQGKEKHDRKRTNPKTGKAIA